MAWVKVFPVDLMLCTAKWTKTVAMSHCKPRYTVGRSLDRSCEFWMDPQHLEIGLYYINAYGHEVHPTPNPEFIKTIAASEALVYSCGSLWTR